MKTTTQNDWQGSALRVDPERQKRNNHSGLLSMHLYQGIVRALAVAWYEILLQVRSIVLWVLLAAFTILTVLYAHSQVSGISGYISDGKATVNICAYAAGFIFFLLPFLFVNTFARDRRHQAYQLIWTRPLASVEYALGKGLGAIWLSLLVSWFPLLVGWLASSIFRGSMQPLLLWVQMLLVVGAVDVLITLCTLFLVVLFSPLTLLGALIPASLVVYVDVAFPKSMFFLSDITATTLFTSPSIGFGPDINLLIWQRLSYVVGGLCGLGWLLLIYQVREKLGVVRLRHIISTALLILVASGMLFECVLTYQVNVAAYTDAGQLMVKPVQASTSQYTLDVTVDPVSAKVDGTVSFELTPQKVQESDFFIGLNPGMHVRRVELISTTGTSLSFIENSAGWTHINLQNTGFENGSTIGLKITYAGQIILGRDDYAQAAPGFGLSEDVSWTQNYFYLSYLGQGIGELLGAAGSWYPVPFTQQAVDAGLRIPVDSVRLRFPHGCKVLSGLSHATTTSDGNWQEVVAQPHASLPVALAVALSSPRQQSVGGLSFWYQGYAPDQEQLTTDRLTMQELQAMNRWLAPANTAQAFQTVVVPILPFPAVGAGLLLLPEKPALNDAIPVTITTIARISAERLAQAWWLNAALFPFVPLSGGQDTQNPDSSTSIQPTNALLDMLTEYSAVTVTGQVLGSNFSASELRVCQDEFTLSSAGTQSTAETQNEQLLQQEMTQLGTTCLFSKLVLYRLQITVGFTRVTSFLQQYAQTHAEQKTDMRQFLQQASVLVGKNIIPEAAPYICPNNGKTTPASASADPLACLNENYSGT